MINEFETLKEGNILPGVEAMDLSATSENNAAVLYDNDELLQDDKPFSDYKALEADSKTKRAWEVVNWRKPKRAWEMISLVLMVGPELGSVATKLLSLTCTARRFRTMDDR